MRLCYRKVITRDYRWLRTTLSHKLYRLMTTFTIAGPVVPYFLRDLGVRPAEREVTEAVRTLYPKGLPKGTIEAPVVRNMLRYLQGNCKKSV